MLLFIVKSAEGNYAAFFAVCMSERQNVKGLFDLKDEI